MRAKPRASEPAQGQRQVPDARRPEILDPRRHLRHVCRANPARRISDARHGRARLRAMAAAGINAVRTYTVPPRWLLDAALRTACGSWSDCRGSSTSRSSTTAAAPARSSGACARACATCAGHPAVLCYAIGNEIPAVDRALARAPQRIERFLERLYRVGQGRGPRRRSSPTSTTRRPSTSSCRSSTSSASTSTSSRTQTLRRLPRAAAEPRRRPAAAHGRDRPRQPAQRRERRRRERSTGRCAPRSRPGCAGTFVFAWTDEWHRGGHDIEDWDFGLTDARAAAQAGAARGRARLRRRAVSPATAVAAHLGRRLQLQRRAHASRQRCDGAAAARLPGLRGDRRRRRLDRRHRRRSRARYDVRLISTENRGLSAPRATPAWRRATGEIVAYIDDDAYPDPHWLHYLAHRVPDARRTPASADRTSAPPGDGPIADVRRQRARRPGPRAALRPRGRAHPRLQHGVPPRSRCARSAASTRSSASAGDDVDVCWRLQERGWTHRLQPGARWSGTTARDSVRALLAAAARLRQGRGAARAQVAGEVQRRRPRDLGAAASTAAACRSRCRAAGASTTACGAPRPSSRVYEPRARPAHVAAADAGVVPGDPAARRLLGARRVLGAAALAARCSGRASALPVAQAIARRACARGLHRTGALTPAGAADGCALTALLHLLQPLARLRGRLRRIGLYAVPPRGPAHRWPAPLRTPR